MIKMAIVDSALSSKVLKPLGYARHAVGRSSVILQCKLHYNCRQMAPWQPHCSSNSHSQVGKKQSFIWEILPSWILTEQTKLHFQKFNFICLSFHPKEEEEMSFRKYISPPIPLAFEQTNWIILGVIFFSLVPTQKVLSTEKVGLGVSRPIYVNVDSPNPGFPYLNF